MGPFTFMTSVESVQLTGRKASSLMELFLGLREVDGSVIYHHTHRFYRAHSFLGSADRSDFALWVSRNLKEEVVGERLGSIDPRDCRTVEDVRAALLDILQGVMEDKERWGRHVPPGLEFHFCKSVSLVFPTGHQARTLEQFTAAVETVDTASLYHHLIEAPLHYHGEVKAFSNDFSQWLADMGFPEQAALMANLDPYRSDLEALRRDVLAIVRANRLRDTVQRALERLPRLTSGEEAAQWIRRWRKGA